MLNVRKKSRKMWRTLQKQDRGAKQREKTTPSQGAKFSHDGNQGANSSVQRVGFSHTSIQGTKLISRCENHCLKCEFPKCNFRTVRNSLLAHECHFRTPQAKFCTVRNKVRNFRTVRNFCTVRNWVRNAIQGAKSSVQRVPFSHTSIQGAKFLVQGAKISQGKILSSKNFKLTFKLKFYPRNCA